VFIFSLEREMALKENHSACGTIPSKAYRKFAKSSSPDLAK
jgi:hypothetical protein